MIKDFLFKKRNNNITVIFAVFFSTAILNHIFYLKTKDLVCFDKKQLTEIEKTLKTNKLLRGTYNDV